jgi:hydroxypyruvate reductase
MHGPESLADDPRRRQLLELFAAACRAVDGRRSVRSALEGRSIADLAADWTLIAVGKAASAMTEGALDVLGPRIVRGLVVSRPGHLDPVLGDWPALTRLEGDHPLPGAASLAAGAALLEFAVATPPGSAVLVLISGGASSLVDVLLPGVGAADLAAVGEWALASGEPIDVVNAVRTRLSRLKGGGLAAALAHTRAEALLISDVPGDDPAVIGSGLVAASAPRALPALPAPLAALLARLPPRPAAATLPCRLVGTLEYALAGMQEAADALGLSTRVLRPPAAGPVARAASRFAHELVSTPEDVLLWGGETTVLLPPVPGRGGRNQQFALEAATLIDRHPDLVVLAAGTDGTDGNTQDAGAIVDAGTVARGAAAGLDAAAALAAADAGTFLAASGDLLHTGPTGTNVGDVVIGIRRGALGFPEAE